jgi:radical SAM protein with 4Fe4S-binding SPASM domain
VEVSLYGASAATYQRITGNGEQLERVVEALRLLRDRGLLVVAKVPVLQENVGELPAIEALCADLGVTASTSAAITMRDDGDRGPLEHRLEQGQLARHLARRHGPPPPGPPPGADAHVCFTGKNALVVTPHGDVHPCVQLKRSCGNLRRSTLQAIWDEAPLLHHLRQLRLCDWTGCPACEHLAYCRPCPGLSWFEHGVLTRPSTCDCRQARALGPPGVSGEGGTGPGTPGCQGLAPGT